MCRQGLRYETIYVVEGAWKYPSRYAHMRALLHRVGGAIEERARARAALVCAHHLKNVSPKFLCARTDGQTGQPCRHQRRRQQQLPVVGVVGAAWPMLRGRPCAAASPTRGIGP